MDEHVEALRRRIEAALPVLWLNPARGCADVPAAHRELFAGVEDARDRMRRFAPLLATLFPDLSATGGALTSPLIDCPDLAGGFELAEGARLLVKADHALPVAGSIKARGGSHAVLEIVERVAGLEGLPCSTASELARPAARDRFARHRISVGSTGNLGLSVGLFAKRLGFAVSVHMSTDAKAWKKELLRSVGADVVEHDGDYQQAVAFGRMEAEGDRRSHFIDDENSLPLLFGYATAVDELARQLVSINAHVDERRPLAVYVPCGVGGAPAGIALGLAARFGGHARCFFVEPTESPCMLAQMLAPAGGHPSVYDLGLSGSTEADGLAVSRASVLAAEIARPLLDGIVTATDDDLFHLLAVAHDVAGLKLEPSAAAGFAGLLKLNRDLDGRRHLGGTAGTRPVADVIQVVWTTGGTLVPADEHSLFLDRGRKAALHPALGALT